MPITLNPANEETPVRRQITGVNFNIVLDVAEIPAQIPTLGASVAFTDLWRKPNGEPVPYIVPGTITLTHAELVAIPHGLEVLAAVQALAYTKAAVELS